MLCCTSLLQKGQRPYWENVAMYVYMKLGLSQTESEKKRLVTDVSQILAVRSSICLCWHRSLMLYSYTVIPCCFYVSLRSLANHIASLISCLLSCSTPPWLFNLSCYQNPCAHTLPVNTWFMILYSWHVCLRIFLSNGSSGIFEHLSVYLKHGHIYGLVHVSVNM